jgi:hypothetical protein
MSPRTDERTDEMTTFQHRHYALIAALLADMDGLDVAEAVGRFASMFARDNPRFNRDRFLAAANGKPTNGRDRSTVLKRG